jgi:hypothetical protein
MPDQARTDSHDGVSRREILKRAAIAGGVAWAAPVIQSITTPAFAQVTPPGCAAGCFWVKVDEGNICEDANGTVTCPSCLGGRTQSQGGCPCVAGKVTENCAEDCVTENCEWTLAPLPAGCTFLGGNSVCAGACGPPARVNPDGSVTFFPCPDPSGKPQCISHIEFCYCCN